MSDQSGKFNIGPLTGDWEYKNDGDSTVTFQFVNAKSAIVTILIIAALGFFIGTAIMSVVAPPTRTIHIECAPATQSAPTEAA